MVDQCVNLIRTNPRHSICIRRIQHLVLFILFINKSLCLKGSILDIKCHNERITLFEAAMLKSAKNAPTIPYWNLLRTNFLITPLYYVLNLF